ncbi:MAG: hypothetical protein HZC51_04465 [Nitrospirae bacterium]|nr:hypothetical protein [Nitrospirota bacterium]
MAIHRLLRVMFELLPVFPLPTCGAGGLGAWLPYPLTFAFVDGESGFHVFPKVNMDRDKLIRRIVMAWVARGIEDLYIALMLLDKFPRQRFTLIQQSIEKLSKAYIIGYKLKNENISEVDATKHVKNLSHGYIDEIDRLSNSRIKKELSSKIVNLPTSANRKNRTTEWALLMEFEKLFSESRYPDPYPHYKRPPYKINKTLGWDMFGSTDIDEVCGSVFRILFLMMKDDIGIPIPKEKPNSRMSDYGWKKFTRLYFAKYQPIPVGGKP